ncbi:hypothetical protein CDD80_961 [Ophiocordyceps camponoti-rufipedis]|uniref:Uncharacterized protein n=1 Tax=Ophiocordyceps camponoti-rufipedis TaxID=2004952 RepID=A0A2C5YBW7_9HYPO|nr:hypothetical protein CDD80_961 [Ophiocordyceps camponoti-rufipedis]
MPSLQDKSAALGHHHGLPLALKSVDEPQYLDRRSFRQTGLKALLAFVTQRIRRGGARPLVLFALLFLVVPALVGLTPASWHRPWTWTLATSDNLRIVVFGSEDLLGSASGRPTWTERLCNERIYADVIGALENRMKETDLTKSPALNYSFVAEQYPIAAQSPDLEAQVQQFLSLRPAVVTPRSTLWVFTFGTWDVWYLAALPRESSEHAVDALVSHLFSQIEVLYGASLRRGSVAFSDYWAGVSASDVDRLKDPGAHGRVDERELESFRIVMPDLLDLTLTPGWQTRPEPPAPHSQAEQMRNAAFLTERWNSKVREELGRWVAKGRAKPNGMDDVGQSRLGPVMDAPYPRRTGLRSTPATTILDAMTEQEMLRTGANKDQEASLLDVRKPCVKGDEACSTPEAHLFHDAFTVSQGAAQEAARMMADKISEELILSARERAV